MTQPTVSLPVLPTGQPLRLTPTDVSQFVRLDQCQRFLRFRLAERAGQRFMADYDVIPQRIAPLLTLSGRRFEDQTEEKLGRQFPAVNLAALSSKAHDRPTDNVRVLDEARRLLAGPVGGARLLFQPRLEVTRDGWLLRGDLDLVRLRHAPAGALDALIVDLKSTVKAKVEHRLQVAFYRLMLEQLCADAGLSLASVQTAILFRGPGEPSPEAAAELAPFKEAAHRELGLQGPFLEVIADGDAYLQAARDLVLGPDSLARRLAGQPFEDIPFALGYPCDGCLYNEFCMKWAAEHDDLSLLPFLAGTDKETLRAAGVRTIRELAHLKVLAAPADGEPQLTPAAGQEPLVRRLAGTWPVGPRLDELIHRARAFRRIVRREDVTALLFLPGHGNSSLPDCRPDLNPNLVRVYVETQFDYLEERMYLLAALVVACQDGVPVRRRTVVRMTSRPPAAARDERDLFVRWTRELAETVVALAVSTDPKAPKPSAPIHFIFFGGHDQRRLLEALARNFPDILNATPPLYDFLTQLAAFDSPIATFLDEEIRTLRNYPLTCQSLTSLARFLKFDWKQPQDFTTRFRARLFDHVGKMEIEGADAWYTRRARFSSSLPLEYAYAAWNDLPKPEKDKHDDFADFRPVTREDLLAFQVRRLEALEHVAGRLTANPNTAKTPFDLPDLADYQDAASTLAHALEEFVTIERLVALADWKTVRHAPPERRVLMGETLLACYREEDQDPATASRNRDNAARARRREEMLAAARARNPDGETRLTREESAECRWSVDGLRVRLRLDTTGLDCDLEQALLLSDLRAGERVVLAPRWSTDERLPEAERRPFTTTPKQLLYATRATIEEIEVQRNEAGVATAACAVVELVSLFAHASLKPYVFSGIDRPLADGELYTLDPCPDDYYGYWCSRVVAGLVAGSPNVLYDRLVSPPPAGDGAGSPGQGDFLAGLDAFQAKGLLHDFEPGKRQFIGGHAAAPVLLVQGPPGTGKSYSTAFALFARVQDALRAGRPCRIFLTCKTHAATDVLLRNVLEVQEKLRQLAKADRRLFEQFFDPHLLDVPLFRFAPRDPQPEGVLAVPKDRDRERGEPCAFDRFSACDHALIGITPGGVYSLVKDRWKNQLFGHSLCDTLVLDEASQMNLPEALMAALPLKPGAPVIVVGDHRQMPPIVRHDWDAEARRTFRRFRVYESLFDTLRAQDPPMIRFQESFRLHAAMADFLREQVYRHDGIPFFSRRTDRLPPRPLTDPLLSAVLDPDYPLVVLTHDEESSQVRNPFEQALIEPILRALSSPQGYGLDAETGLGIVVPHRAQRAALQQAFPHLCVLDAATGLPGRSAIDTVERFQGGERTVIMVSATESDRAYLLATSEFLLDPRRLTVALSRAKQKMVLAAARSIFALFSPDEEVFANALLWKNLLRRTCTTLLWQGARDGRQVAVWGGGPACSPERGNAASAAAGTEIALYRC